MKTYLDIVHNVLHKGKWKKPVRRGSDGSEVILPYDTLALPNQCFSHNMADGFPLLTTKKMAKKSILVELEGFIAGITSKKWYQDRGCNIWNEWANPTKVNERIILWQHQHAKEYQTGKELVEASAKLEKQFAREEDDLGPIYGYQWRHFNTPYPGGYDSVKSDQLKNIVDTLHNAPYDRRMVCSAWNPLQINEMALPPCHFSFDATVIGDELSLMWAQRSCDLMLGVPFNIASYATLLLLLAKEGGFKPGNLTGVLVDCHIYANQIEGAKEQLAREPKPLPTLEILDNDGKFSIFDWKHTDTKLHNYVSHEKLSFGEVTV